MKSKDFYQVFIDLRNRLYNSIDNGNTLIDQVTDYILDPGNNITVNSTMLSDGKTSISITPYNEGFKIVESTGEDSEQGYVNTETIIPNIDDIDYTTLPISGLNLNQVLQDVNDSTALNIVVAKINDQLLNYGECSASYANQIINAQKDIGSGKALMNLQDTILAGPDGNITPNQWSSVISNLILPNVYKYKVAEAAGKPLNNLILDEYTHAVQSFVGTVILQGLANIIQVVGLIVAYSFKIAGFALSLIGAGISWLWNTVVVTDYRINRESVNRLLDTPLVYQSLPLTFFPVRAGKDFIPINGFGVCATIPSKTAVCWVRGDGENAAQVFYNEYLNMGISYTKLIQWIRDNYNITQLRWDSGTLRFHIESVEAFDPSQTRSPFEYLSISGHIPDEIILSQDELEQELTSNDGCTRLIAAAWLYGQLSSILMQHDNVTNRDVADINIQTPLDYMPSPNDSIETITKTLVAHMMCSGLSVSTYHGSPTMSPVTASEFEQILSVVINKYNAAVSSYNDFDNMRYRVYDFDDDGQSSAVMTISPYFTTAKLMDDALWSYASDPITYTKYFAGRDDDFMSTCEISTFPTSRLLSWPDYTPDALVNTIAVAVGFVVATTAVAGLIAVPLARRINKYKFDRTQQLNALRDTYNTTHADSDYTALRKAARSYNFKAKLFGWDTYDMTNGWFNESNQAVPSSDSPKDNTNQIIRLIKGR